MKLKQFHRLTCRILMAEIRGERPQPGYIYMFGMDCGKLEMTFHIMLRHPGLPSKTPSRPRSSCPPSQTSSRSPRNPSIDKNQPCHGIQTVIVFQVSDPILGFRLHPVINDPRGFLPLSKVQLGNGSVIDLVEDCLEVLQHLEVFHDKTSGRLYDR